jgi:hypothetical protein
MAVDAALLDRAGELKRDLVAFSQQKRFNRAAREFLAGQGDGSEVVDEHRLVWAWDAFVLEHRLPDGQTVLERFVDAHPELPPAERDLLLGWLEVVQGPFEVQRRAGPVLIVTSLVDELIYRVRANTGPAVFRRMPRRSFLIARLVPIGDEWMLSGPTSVLRPADRKAAFQLALEIALRMPEAVFRNPEKLAVAWAQQRADRERFIRFFGADLVVFPGDQVQERLNAFHAFCREELLRAAPRAAKRRAGAEGSSATLPADIVEAETVALIHDETDGLGFYTEFGLVEEAFADPDLVRRRRWREQVLAYLHDDSIEPMVLRRLADRDPERASILFQRLLKRRRFEWQRDGEQLLREAKPDYYAQVPRPRVSPVSERLGRDTARAADAGSWACSTPPAPPTSPPIWTTSPSNSWTSTPTVCHPAMRTCSPRSPSPHSGSPWPTSPTTAPSPSPARVPNPNRARPRPPPCSAPRPGPCTPNPA